MWFNQTLLSLFEFISTISIIQWQEIVDKDFQELNQSDKRVIKLQTKTNIHIIWNQDSNPGTSYLSYYLDPDSSSGYYLLLLPIW